MAAVTEVMPPPARVPRRPPRLRDLGRPLQWALGAVLLLGLGLRMWAALNPVEDPGPDAEAYASIARWLFEAQRFGSPAMAAPSDWSPGAPLFYAAVYYLVGDAEPAAARIAMALAGTGMVLCTFLLGLRLAGRAAGLIAALVIATYPAYIENNAQLLSEPFAAFLLTAGLLGLFWAFDGRRTLAWLLPGLFLGALILTRPEYQPIVLALALLVAWKLRRDGRAWRPALGAGAVVLLGAVLVVGPWTVRNYVVLDKLVPVTTGAQKALFVATYLPGGGRQVPVKRELMRRLNGERDPITTDELRAQPMNELLDKVARKYPHMPRDAALARIGRENARRYISERPLDYAAMSVAKFWNMWERGSSPYMAAWGWVAWHRLLMVLGMAGLVVLARSARTRSAALLLGVPLAAISVLGTILLSVPRRQVPLMPIIAVLAAVAVVRLAGEIRRRRAAAA